MTETTGSLVALSPEDHVPEGGRRLLSAGKAFPRVELAIRDAEGRSLPDGAIGEVAIRSPSNMLGYHNLSEATREAIDADGWLRTGDSGYQAPAQCRFRGEPAAQSVRQTASSRGASAYWRGTERPIG